MEKRFLTPLRFSLVMLSLASLAACHPAATGPQLLAPTRDMMGSEPIVVKPGDQVLVSLFTSEKSIPYTALVARDGFLRLPDIPPFPVKGMTELDILRRLQNDTLGYPRIYTDVFVQMSVLVAVNVTGSVRGPRQMMLPSSATILDAITNAGGPEPQTGSDGGAQKVVELVRDNKTYVFGLASEQADPYIAQVRIQSGDWLFVPSRHPSKIGQYSFMITLATAASSFYLLFTK